jgi:hypothetical protein
MSFELSQSKSFSSSFKETKELKLKMLAVGFSYEFEMRSFFSACCRRRYLPPFNSNTHTLNTTDSSQRLHHPSSELSVDCPLLDAYRIHTLTNTPLKMMNAVSISRLFLLLVSAVQVEAFVSSPSAPAFVGSSSNARLTRLFAADEKAAPMVTGEELEIMLTEWEEPLVIDAYATW